MLLLAVIGVALGSASPDLALLKSWLNGPRQVAYPSDFKASIAIKTVAGNAVQRDSGSVVVGRNGCSRVEFTVARTVLVSCGDSTWMRLPDGRIVPMPSGTGGASSFGRPPLAQLLRGVDFEFDHLMPDGSWMLRFTRMLPGGMTIPVKVVVSPGNWLLRSMSMPSPTGMIETSYHYAKFEGNDVLQEVNVIAGSSGFQRITVGGYQKTAPPEKSVFRLN